MANPTATRGIRYLILACMMIAGCSKSSDSPTTVPPAESSPATAEPAATSPPQTSATAPIELDAEKLLSMRLPAEQTSQGWVRLFDGSTMYGWSMAGKANWAINEGGILSVSEGEVSLLCTTLPWSDFEFQVDFLATPETNSGIFLRTPLVPQDPASDCYELNIAPADNPFPTASLVKRKKWEPADLGQFDPAQWHTYLVRAVGSDITISLDGKELYTYTDPDPLTKGHIALQHNSGLVQFRNVLARPLNFKSLFPVDEASSADASAASDDSTNDDSTNDDSIAGWKRYPDMAGEFTVTDEGWLHAKGGKNQLESSDQYADFALLVTAKTAGPKQNSGIFFRCIPGEEMNGYECQINNDSKDGNPLLPADCGTGGIFRRQDARIIAAENEQWFDLMLIADGPDMAAWVNGIQVSEWSDDRAADPNPRRGQRLEAGTLMLQAHDPTTDVTFKSIQISAPPVTPAE